MFKNVFILIITLGEWTFSVECTVHRHGHLSKNLFPWWSRRTAGRPGMRPHCHHVPPPTVFPRQDATIFYSQVLSRQVIGRPFLFHHYDAVTPPTVPPGVVWVVTFNTQSGNQVILPVPSLRRSNSAVWCGVGGHVQYAAQPWSGHFVKALRHT